MTSSVAGGWQHFVCAHCEKPFEGRRHFEKKGQAYCERDYKMVSYASSVQMRFVILGGCVCVCHSSLEIFASAAASHVVAMVSNHKG